LDDRAAGDLREARVHRIRRLEQQGRAPVAAEYEEHVAQHVVAALPEDQLLGLDAVPRRERRAEVGRRGGGRVAIEQDVVELVWREVEACRIRIGPFV